MKSKELSIIERIRELKQIEREFLKFTYETKKPDELSAEDYLKKILQISSKAFNLRYQILLDSDKVNAIKIHDEETKKIFCRIRDDQDNFYSVNCYKEFAESINKHLAVDKRSPVTLQEVLDSNFMSGNDEIFDFHGWFDLVEFYLRRIKVGPLISASAIPDHIKYYFMEIRDAYAFGLHIPCIALCRSLLEMSLFAKLTQKKLLTQVDPKIVDIKKYYKDKLIDLICLAYNHGLINREMKNLSSEIRKSGNQILHLKDTQKRVCKDDSFIIIKNTVRVLEFLYK